ncbi:MAG: hypothetical protein KAU31_08390, partial [Spirochaetaceae bacterium]|nr:hypothetical protein [Spirochaetaceae bacterium]
MVEFVGSVFGQIIMYSTVYALAALGIVIAGRTGIFNIAGEGIMLAAAAMGYVSAVRMVSWVAGVAIGGAIGAVFALFLVFMHEQLKVNQFIMGIAIIILGA